MTVCINIKVTPSDTITRLDKKTNQKNKKNTGKDAQCGWQSSGGQ